MFELAIIDKLLHDFQACFQSSWSLWSFILHRSFLVTESKLSGINSITHIQTCNFTSGPASPTRASQFRRPNGPKWPRASFLALKDQLDPGSLQETKTVFRILGGKPYKVFLWSKNYFFLELSLADFIFVFLMTNKWTSVLSNIYCFITHEFLHHPCMGKDQCQLKH